MLFTTDKVGYTRRIIQPIGKLTRSPQMIRADVELEGGAIHRGRSIAATAVLGQVRPIGVLRGILGSA